jgi:hypothetical protein
MLIAYIHWRDACAVEADNHPPVAELAEEESVGFLLHETDEAVLIGMEAEGPIAGRWRLNIPKAMIISMKTVELERAFNRKARTVIG